MKLAAELPLSANVSFRCSVRGAVFRAQRVDHAPPLASTSQLPAEAGTPRRQLHGSAVSLGPDAARRGVAPYTGTKAL